MIGQERSEEEEKDAQQITEEDQERLDELEAETRQIYDPINKIFDDHKRRVTDLQECSRFILPKALPTQDEALFEMLRNAIGKIFGEHRDAH